MGIFVAGVEQVGLTNAEAKAEFISALQDLGKIELLAFEWPTSGTSFVEASANLDVVTPVPSNFNAFDTPPNSLGRNGGTQLHLNGSDEYVSLLDSSDHSFGDGAVDQAFTVVALVNPTSVDANETVAAKLTSAAEEWDFGIRSSTDVFFQLRDEGASARINRYGPTPAINTWQLVSGTYDGSRASTGLHVYLQGVVVDDTTDDSGTYVGMDNGAALVTIGVRNIGSLEQYFGGTIGFVAIFRKELTAEENARIVSIVNKFYAPAVAI